MIKRCFIDIESTGLDKSCALIQLGAIIDFDGEIQEKINFKIQPFETDFVEEEAAKLLGITEENFNDLFEDPYIKPMTAYIEFQKILKKYINPFKKPKDKTGDKFWFIGYNALGFDYGFYRNWIEKKLNQSYFDSYFWTPAIDVMALAGEYLMDKRPSIDKFKLMNVAKAMDIEVDETKAHDALYDIEITREMYYKIIKK